MGSNASQSSITTSTVKNGQYAAMLHFTDLSKYIINEKVQSKNYC
ncbi:hypothetical protein GPLA_2883 [Paraglaciecola polaris LMG 21857]|uniref:Uncharacterized protein n=1 Tax=Paraglaciecola polaris LMG 21857 TaxID=1129793 RepID=K6ZU08_9ALTE|nr:hypothetical protein GPLA_2883 [Paraglaciecola polaris LMG 21857]